MPSADRHVLHVMRMSAASGSENHLLSLTRAMAPLGWRSSVLIPAPDPAPLEGFSASLEESCEAVELIRAGPDASPALLRRLRAASGRGEYDVVHSHLVHADWHLAAAAPIRGRSALVSTKHNHDPFRARAPFRLIERALGRRFDAVIAISQSLSEFVRRHSALDAETVYYGLDAPPERPPRTPPASEAPTLLAVGRLEEQKGFDVLLEAMAALRERLPGARLRIAGDGSWRSELESRRAALGLDDTVELLGRREDVPELMRAADLLVHPARWEGFGLVLLEAMREGLPVVASRVGAIPEVVEDGVTGLLVEPDDPRALADAVVRAAQPDAALALGRAGHERVRGRFAPRAMAAGTAEVYERALVSRRRQPRRAPLASP